MRETRAHNLCLGFLSVTKLALAKHERRPVPSYENISNNVNSPKFNLNLLEFLKAVTLSF